VISAALPGMKLCAQMQDRELGGPDSWYGVVIPSYLNHATPFDRRKLYKNMKSWTEFLNNEKK
jgi:hypothetical protein